MNVLIIENEKPAVDGLVRLLKNIDTGINVVGVTESVESTINWFQGNPNPDLIFMDIQLDDGLCFELFETINIEIPVIFTTAYNEYMLSAFKVNSVDYLLKPIEENNLRRAIEKFKSIHYNASLNNEVIKQLLNELNKGYKNRFLIKVGEHYKSITDTEIACFHIWERATFLRTTADHEYVIDHSLDNLQKMLDPGKFFRVNRNCIINIGEISDIINYSSSRLKILLKSKKPIQDIIVSKDKVSEFKRWIDK
ncbi:MAG: LytTR family DNA-binding domain-containing protein [Bacteroidales bacterium]|jgi:DNA-binding LytR/AlgR family response regulator|nr:LytTR family DNA-binding domain-containing protein [Bacteroidales bacterium]MDD2832199.1 LytTR family DNA-binding domain-containing protein [Bacteroidales bacterium]MDD4474001.1 LytTR family DNA-binding domain-containing protein [Bacteroidales bacterium]MDD5046978.1 LytTR family DNA-binding domain-containing protein [Bacteroidales bacterium]MDD5517531.1 LytTR family DNA-binding domain-containing protein [Bacteroidales bacterium]